MVANEMYFMILTITFIIQATNPGVESYFRDGRRLLSVILSNTGFADSCLSFKKYYSVVICPLHNSFLSALVMQVPADISLSCCD